MEEILKVNDVSKTFRLSKKQQKIERTKETKKVAVRNLSFSAYRGEIYGLLGPNGAGKTTTLRMISTLIRPDEGDIEVMGHSVKKDPDLVRKQIGFLTSELKLEDFFTPNYLYDYYASLHGVDPQESAERKRRVFKRFGIDRFAEVKVGDLSTGMKQKASIAISLVHDPDVIIFDEPTNGLDVLTAKTVTDFLLELKNQGKTVIVSTHIFSLIEKICDRVGIIMKGTMIREDTLERLTEGRNLEEVFFDIYQKEMGES